MSEKIEYHTLEEKEACDLIRYFREYQRNYFVSKIVVVSIDFEEGHSISARTVSRVNKRTGIVSIGHSISYCGVSIYPTTTQKLRCTNQHALDYLRSHKKLVDGYPNRFDLITFYTPIATGIGITEQIRYRKDTGDVYASGIFHINLKYKCKIIDELDGDVN